jgi:hypothetical protein
MFCYVTENSGLYGGLQKDISKSSYPELPNSAMFGKQFFFPDVIG